VSRVPRATILVVGASGFIGRHVADGLDRDGHSVRRASRPEIDLARDDAASWRPRLEGVHVVVNCAGVFRGDFPRVHVQGAIALFEACAARGVRVVQFSALGADAAAASEFQRSKQTADAALLSMAVPSIVLQPSLVHGEAGASARLFATLASLPLIPLPGEGAQRIQPVHIDDVVDAVRAVVRSDFFPRARLALVGPEPLTLRDYLAQLRRSMGLGRARYVQMPQALVGLAAGSGLGLLGRDSLAMLERGNTADASALRELLGREPKPAAKFDVRARDAQLGWLMPLLRVAIAIVWLTAGVVSAGVFPVEESLAMLARTGIAGTAATFALYAAAAFDFAIGIATLALRRRRALWTLQLAVILGYTAIITLFLPEQWLHPFGPVVKNLPLLAAILLLRQVEAR
jgi:uncharacterized protein YbjT (DUF2867 family)